MSLLLILADISPIFTFCSGQFIVSFIYLSKMLYAMLSIGVKVKVKVREGGLFQSLAFSSKVDIKDEKIFLNQLT